MKFFYGKHDFSSIERSRESGWLLTNGLGGFSSMTIAGEASRNDHAVLMACTKAPNYRVNVVHRLQEILSIGEENEFLSTQQFTERQPENGWKHLSFMEVDGLPRWLFQWKGIQIEKQVAMAYGENTVAVQYRVYNDTQLPCTLRVRPWMQFAPKGEDLAPETEFLVQGDTVEAAGLRLRVVTNGLLTKEPLQKETLFYSYDICDGRRSTGEAAAMLSIDKEVPAEHTGLLELVFSLEESPLCCEKILYQAQQRRRALVARCGLKGQLACQLAESADAFIARRDSTGGSTILAGYPFFADWGRDTMIALPGCTLSTGRYEEAKSILQTFMENERDGLMPNLFPEGESEPLYNTVDAALLFINCVYLYHWYTGDSDFVRQAYPTMEKIMECYQKGTKYHIRMEEDGLIAAGDELEQLTWMDVRIGDHLPTPRHGKPVEINAYWYNAACVMDALASIAGRDGAPYRELSRKIRDSFQEKFWWEEKHCLRDVLSGGPDEEQLRCNQIWAVSMPFTMLNPEQEKQVVEAVGKALYTPLGLRTLDPKDPDFHPTYGGPQEERDLAYHQGTVWPFPLGAYYLAYLKVHSHSTEAARRVKSQMEALLPALREGCAGQLPEIYDGENPTVSRGCFAQAWSVGELLRAAEQLERNDICI